MQIEQLVSLPQKHIKNQELQLEALRSRVEGSETTVDRLSTATSIRRGNLADFTAKFYQESAEM